MTLEERIREIADGVPYPYKGNLREAAVDIRKLEDRIKQLEEENDAMRADLLLWKDFEVKP